MTQEHRYSLTRVCLRRGELSLPRSMTGMFQGAEQVRVLDTISDEHLELTLQGDRILGGLGEYFAQHDLQVNDTVLVRETPDGGISFTAQQRQRRQDYSSKQAGARIVEKLLDAGPVTEAEARALLPGLPDDFDLAGLLRADGRLQLRGGRWRQATRVSDEVFDRQVDEALDDALRSSSVPAAEPAQAAPAAADTPASSEAQEAREFVSRAMQSLGFRVQPREGESLLLDARGPASGAPGFTVLARILPEGRRLDWAGLLEQRRETGAQCLAVFGTSADADKLSAPAELAQATLWSFSGLERVLEVARSVPICAVDLESHFRHDGLHGRGLERFERTIDKRIAERGAFSTVLANLAMLGGPGSFRLEDVARGVDGDGVRQVLDQLQRAPFQLVIRSDNGDYYLRGDVQTALAQLADYAQSLLGHMPRSRAAAGVTRV